MTEELIRLENETEDEYLYRIGMNKTALGLTWDSIADIMNENWRDNSTEYKTESVYRKKFRSMINNLTSDLVENPCADTINEVDIKIRELERSKIKLRDEKREYNRWLRSEARDETIAEQICQAIHSLPEIQIPNRIVADRCPKSAVLAWGDEHYAAEFEIKGLHGETINKYNPEIFENRMWDLFHQVVDIVQREGITVLYAFALGDFSDGVLRCGQLKKLRYGVVEGTCRYANFIANWLNELSRYVTVKYQMVFGNHTELRMLGQPKGTFEDENTGLFVREIIKTRLEHNPNFEMTINPTGLIFDNIEGFNVLGIHGEVKNMERALKDFSITYNTDIDILLGAHLHHQKNETIGINKDTINVPSIIGVDNYSMKLNKTSNPGASLFFIEPCRGVTVEYKIKL